MRMNARRFKAVAVAAVMLLTPPAWAAGLQTGAPAPRVEGMVAQPCPADAFGRSEAEQVGARLLVDPDADLAAHKAELLAMAAAGKAAEARAGRDWPDLCRYQRADAEVVKAGAAKVVFIGDSITELWGYAEPKLFTGGVVDRGISGQTSPQILLRFYADVVALHPKVVHILAGANDVAGNTGPSRVEDLENNIRAMVDIARANHIQVVLASALPAKAFAWRPALKPAEQIVSLNAWLKTYAAQRGLVFADYYPLLADAEGGIPPALSRDGVHPLRTGYQRLDPVARAAVAKALAKAAAR